MRHPSVKPHRGTDEIALSPAAPVSIAMPGILDERSTSLLERMFRDPRVLEEYERRDLIAKLRQAVSLVPEVAEVRVLLGMALCTDLQAQEALEELREAAKLAPDSYIAQLKFGELLMRLRICDQAAEYTARAARLAANAIQSEAARRQAATIRTMMREGIERGGYIGFFAGLKKMRATSRARKADPALVISK